MQVYVTGIVKVDSAEIAVLDRDLGSVESQKKYDLHFLQNEGFSQSTALKLFVFSLCCF